MKLISNSATLEKIASVGLSGTQFTPSQLWNGQAYLIYRYSSFSAINDVEKALVNLGEHFELAHPGASGQEKDIARAFLLFNSALMVARDRARHGTAAHILDSASNLLTSRGLSVPESFDELRKEASAGPVLHAEYLWFPLI